MVESFFFVHSVHLCLLIGIVRPFVFKGIVMLKFSAFFFSVSFLFMVPCFYLFAFHGLLSYLDIS